MLMEHNGIPVNERLLDRLQVSSIGWKPFPATLGSKGTVQYFLTDEHKAQIQAWADAGNIWWLEDNEEQPRLEGLEE